MIRALILAVALTTMGILPTTACTHTSNTQKADESIFDKTTNTWAKEKADIWKTNLEQITKSGVNLSTDYQIVFQKEDTVQNIGYVIVLYKAYNHEILFAEIEVVKIFKYVNSWVPVDEHTIQVNVYDKTIFGTKPMAPDTPRIQL